MNERFMRYSYRCCISRSTAATAVLTPDLSTSREEQMIDDGDTNEDDMDGGVKYE